LKDRADIVFFDSGSNFQLAGRIMQAVHPRITVVHGLEHVLSLLFEDIAKIEVLRVSVLFGVFCLLYYTHTHRLYSPLCLVDPTGEKNVSDLWVRIQSQTLHLLHW
jgi:hypothetical protein